MPQTTTAFVQGATGGTNPGNLSADDGANATTATTLVVAGPTITGDTWNLLEEDAGTPGPATGIKIPAGASIVGVRFQWGDMAFSGTSPTATITANAGGTAFSQTGVSGNGTKTRGYGTLSAGSTYAGGNDFFGSDLSTNAGQLSARADLADAVLTQTVQGTGGGVGNGTTAVDYFRVQVEWVLKKDGAGTASSTSFTAGAVTAQATQAGTGRTDGFSSAVLSGTIMKVGDVADSDAAVSGVASSTQSHTGSASSSASSSGTATVVATSGGPASSYSFGSGTMTMQATQAGSASGLSVATGVLTAIITEQGDVVDAQSFASGVATQTITRDGVGTSTAHASAESHPIATAYGQAGAEAIARGVARAYSFAISGYAYDQTETPLEGVRVDVYRTSDHQHMGRVFTDATGYYSYAIPNQPQTFWARFYSEGATDPQDQFDTTVDWLALVESQVQGPQED